jgi:TatD DNase family protein
MWIDSHAHLDFPDFGTDLEKVLERAHSAGVHRILNIGNGISPDERMNALRLAKTHSMLDASVGIHPHDSRLAQPEDFALLLQIAQEPEVVAWGEIGLDYHYDNSPRQIQQAVFRKQLELAACSDLPVIVHTREAEDDTLGILGELWRGRPGVMHCFSGSRELAESSLEAGFFISFSGILTFPKAAGLREIAASIPLDRLLVETDCPYLAPVPHRGKRNEPAWVVETAQLLSVIKQVDHHHLARVISGNYFRLFKRARARVQRAGDVDCVEGL